MCTRVLTDVHNIPPTQVANSMRYVYDKYHTDAPTQYICSTWICVTQGVELNCMDDLPLLTIALSSLTLDVLFLSSSYEPYRAALVAYGGMVMLTGHCHC